jgi:hypothetical protein
LSKAPNGLRAHPRDPGFSQNQVAARLPAAPGDGIYRRMANHSLLHRRSNRLCGARLSAKQRLARGHSFCRAVAMANGRCPFHGGKSIGWRTPEGAIRRDQARVEGVKRWRDRMRAAIAAGLIDRFPQGRKKGDPRLVGKPPLYLQRRANAAATEQTVPAAPKEIVMARRTLAAVPAAEPAAPVPWEQKSRAEQLAELTGKALGLTKALLELPIDPENLKLLSIQKDAALSILSTQIKVDEGQLRQDDTKRALILAEIARRVEETGGGGK